MDNVLDTVSQDLDEARARIVEARQTLQAAPQDAPEIRQAIVRLERMEVEVDRIESGIAVREGLG